MIPIGLLLETKPVLAWTRAWITQVTNLDGSSWTNLAESVRRADWPIALSDLRLIAYQYMTAQQRIIGVRRSTQRRIAAQSQRWPDVPTEVKTTRADLLRWANGQEVDLQQVWRRAENLIRDARTARSATVAVTDVAADAAVVMLAGALRATVEATEKAAARALQAAVDAAAEAAEVGATAEAAEGDAWTDLIFICQLLDGAP